jgi:hypothetical protein
MTDTTINFERSTQYSPKFTAPPTDSTKLTCNLFYNISANSTNNYSYTVNSSTPVQFMKCYVRTKANNETTQQCSTGDEGIALVQGTKYTFYPDCTYTKISPK